MFIQEKLVEDLENFEMIDIAKINNQINNELLANLAPV